METWDFHCCKCRKFILREQKVQNGSIKCIKGSYKSENHYYDSIKDEWYCKECWEGRTMTLEELDKIQRVRMNDFTEYDYDRCYNGGCYGFWTEYTRMEDGKWRVNYGTTSDLEFCPVCGAFGNHWDDEEEKYECGDFCHVTDEILLNRINRFIETDDEYLEMF